MEAQLKKQITKALEADRKVKAQSQSAYSRYLKISKATYSAVTNEKWEEISTTMWMKLARAIDFTAESDKQWATASTVVFRKITTQLNTLKALSMCGIACDIAGIGKTHACKHFAKHNPESYYINCSNCTTKSRFVRELASKLGLEQRGNIEDILQDCIFFIATVSKQPILILDEAGDLKQSALLVLKRLYNGTEFQLAIYAIGARGLEHAMMKGIRLRKNGYEEIWSRLTGDDNHAIRFTPETKPQLREFFDSEAILICEANGITDKAVQNQILMRAGDMRRVRREIMKLRNVQQLN